MAHARSIPGWLTRNEGLLLGQLASAAPSDAVIVEIGSFLGRSAVVIAGALKERGNGILHCIDPFDASGDSFSAPIYKAISDGRGLSLRQDFERNVARAGVDQWIRIRQGTAVAAAEGWHMPIDLLFMDGDQSPDGVRSAHERWGPFLKVGGIIGLHNSSERTYAVGHDGHHLLARDLAASSAYINFVSVDSTTSWRRLH
jgi:predicted O-methyltransferase YrrM